MNTANKITLIRIAMIPIFMALLMVNTPLFRILSLVVFVIAAATDGIDGYIARHYNQITTFGKFVDPLADKLLVTSAFIILLYFGRVSVWAVMIIIAREFIVTGIRLVAISEGTVIAASFWGKLKTVTQMVAVIGAVMLMGDMCPDSAAQLITDILVWLSVAVTVFSGADYVIKSRNFLRMK